VNIALLASILAITLGQPTPDALDLPPGVKGTCERFGGVGREADQLKDRVDFEIGQTWSRAETYQPNGSFGWTISGFSLATDDEVVTYDAMSERATRTGRSTPWNEPVPATMFSPIGWFHVIDQFKRNGASYSSSTEEGRTIHQYDLGGGQTVLRIAIDPDTGRIDSATVDYKQHEGIEASCKYLDWQPLSDGSSHPRRIEMAGFDMDSNTPFRGTILIREIEPLPASAKPSAYTFPTHAMVYDYIDNVSRNGAMEVLGPLIAANSSGGVSEGATRKRAWFIWGGVGVILLSGVAWRLGRRGHAA
jgi:hypothetical protein